MTTADSTTSASGRLRWNHLDPQHHLARRVLVRIQPAYKDQQWCRGLAPAHQQKGHRREEAILPPCSTSSRRSNTSAYTTENGDRSQADQTTKVVIPLPTVKVLRSMGTLRERSAFCQSTTSYLWTTQWTIIRPLNTLLWHLFNVIKWTSATKIMYDVF